MEQELLAQAVFALQSIGTALWFLVWGKIIKTLFSIGQNRKVTISKPEHKIKES